MKPAREALSNGVRPESMTRAEPLCVRTPMLQELAAWVTNRLSLGCSNSNPWSLYDISVMVQQAFQLNFR